MRLFLIIIIGALLSGASALACNGDTLQKLTSYGQNYKLRSMKSVTELSLFSLNIQSNYKFLNNYTINKSELLEDDFLVLLDSEEKFINKVDEIYEEQELAMELFGFSEDEALYSELLSCVGDDRKEAIKILIEAHLKEVNLDESIMTSVFDSYYNYSSILVSYYDSYLEWYSDNNSGNVPTVELFQPLLTLSEKTKVGEVCVRDLMTASFKSYCLIEKELKIESEHCKDDLYSEILDCF